MTFSIKQTKTSCNLFFLKSGFQKKKSFFRNSETHIVHFNLSIKLPRLHEGPLGLLGTNWPLVGHPQAQEGAAPTPTQHALLGLPSSSSCVSEQMTDVDTQCGHRSIYLCQVIYCIMSI